jgi:hypothetical protein
MVSIFNMKHVDWVDDGETSLCYYELFLDSSSDLPSDLYMFSTATAKYKIAQGSLAYDIGGVAMYMMKSDGTWVKQ